MFKSEWIIGSGEDFAPVRALRERVYVGELGVSAAAEFDALDDYAAHLYICTDAGEPIACGRMFPDGDAIRIDRFAVAPAYRGKLYDDLTLRVMLYKAQQAPFSAIEALVAPEDAPLFARFGFAPAGAAEELRGLVCERLCVPRTEVIWDSACKH